MAQSIGSCSVEEHVQGGTLWVSIRARGSEWSWLTEDEAAAIGRQWVAQYGAQSGAVAAVTSRSMQVADRPARI